MPPKHPPQPGPEGVADLVRPKGLVGAIDLSDDENQWFDNYMIADRAGQAWMFLEVEKPKKP